MREGAGRDTPGKQRANIWCGHARGSELRSWPGLSPTERSRINRSRRTLPAKHGFSGPPEFCSWRRCCVALSHR
jgi:hypothetical protein